MPPMIPAVSGILSLPVAQIGGPEIVMRGLVVALICVSLVTVLVIFILREKVRDRRKRELKIPANYYRSSPPPPLPEKRKRGGPPQLPERRN